MDLGTEEKLHFEVSSALKSVIGRDLITNDFVAIFELVKNSFDARASKVDLVFDSKNEKIDSIFVVDDGKGMSRQDIEDKWLFVAYSAKGDGTEDKNINQTYAGNKGVGRFSCDRIGGKLRLQSKIAGESKVHVLDVDWGAFEENSKTKFEKVDINYSEQDSFDLPDGVIASDSGVVLQISSLRDNISWDRQKLLRLKRHLSKLINPFGDASSVIDINLKCAREIPLDVQDKLKNEITPDKTPEVVNGPIKNTVFEILKSKTTWLQVDLDSNGDFFSSLVDRGELIYKIKESSDEFPELRDSDFSCQIFYLNRAAKQTFKLRMGVTSVDFGSLLLFRNGFRVFPVGETGDDYWEVERRHQQGYARTFGTRDIMGRVDIAGPESKFKESSSRDRGLVETTASKQLFNCVIQKCIRRLESYVVGITWKDKLDKDYDSIQRLGLDENRSRIIDLIESLANSKVIELLEYSHNLIEVLSEKSKYFESSVEKLSALAHGVGSDELMLSVNQARERFAELKAAEEEALRIADEEMSARLEAERIANEQVSLRVKAESEANTLSYAYEEEKKRNLFLLTNENRDKDQLESFLHQIIIYTAEAKQKLTSSILDIKSGNYNFNKDEVISSYSDLLESVDKIMTTSRFATTANFKLDSTAINDDVCLYLEEYISKICTAYHNRIKTKVNVLSKEFIMTFTPIELGMVLDNLVSNAKKARASLITFDVREHGKGVLEIEVTDNGRGLSSGIKEPKRIFEKGVTTTRGSGLGLYHSQKQIEKMGGEMVLPEVQPRTGFKLLIRLRKT